jgi:uncharacterized protein YodC (DUF2158 family)
MAEVKAEFKVGDVVRLKSGGPLMTVRFGDVDWLSTTWFDETHNLVQEHSFRPQQVESVQQKASA